MLASSGGAEGGGGGTGDGGALRLFFSFVPDEARGPLAEVGARLALCAGARRVPPENLHMTLAFVGEVPSAQLPAVLQLGRSVRGLCCSIEFDAYEYWPKPEVVVAAARVIPAPLEALWRDAHAELARLELAAKPKRLRPHVTLAHGVSQEPVLPAERAREALLMGLRLAEGVHADRFAARTCMQLDRAIDAGIMEAAVEAGYLQRTPTHLIATAEGRRRLDALLPRLLL